MATHAREGFELRGEDVRVASPARSRARIVSVIAVAATTAVVAAMFGVLATPAGAAQTARQQQLRTWTDAQLATSAGALEAEATQIGERLLASDSQRDEIVRNRDASRRLLAQFLAESYKQGSVSGDIVAQVLSSGSLREAADRAQVADAVGSYHRGLQGALDDAETRLDVSSVERARLITRLSFIQAQLVDVQTEQGRRAAIRAAHAQARAEERAAEQARTDREQQAAAAAIGAVASPGTLVANSPFVAAGGPPSAAAIDAYLASKGSPMTGQGAAFMQSAMRWRVDPRLLVAIAGAESNFGEITCGPNNAWGWACPNDPADFATWAHGIDTVTEGLRRYYLDESRTSVVLIHQKYAPVAAANDPTGLNAHWPRNVTKFLVEQGGNPAQVGPGPSGAGALQLPSFGLLAGD